MAQVIVESTGATPLQQKVTVGAHSLLADEAAEASPNTTGPAPFDLLLAALGSCTSMTVSMYARRKGWKLERVRVQLAHAKVPAPNGGEGQVDRITREVTFEGALSAEERTRLLDIANKCPVHKALTSKTLEVETRETPAARA